MLGGETVLDPNGRTKIWLWSASLNGPPNPSFQGLVFGQNITKSFRIHHLHANSLTVVKVVGENMNSFGVYGMPHILCCLVFRSQLSFKLESHFQKVAIMELVLAMKMA